ncbi:MAG: 2-dehydropantoate 2-reductase, partial [Burkholderiales bacterium]
MTAARICIVGAGAIGGYLAVRLARAGNHVSVIARGAHLAAIRAAGLTLIDAGGGRETVTELAATDTLSDLGPQDIVIITVKAHQLEAVVDELPRLFHADTLVVPMQNGIPYWYFQRHGGQWDGYTISSVDPRGRIAAAIDPQRVIGCVVYPATAVVQPGVIRHIEGNRFPFGELDGRETERVARLSRIFTDAGLKSPVLDHIRSEIWLKLWGNLSFNPISALTHATLADICRFPLSRGLAAAMMTEAQEVAQRLGITFRLPLEKRIAGAEKVGHHKTSMLQDLEAGRALEIDALLGSVIELGKLTCTSTPHLDAIYACVKLLS